jgi:4-hydroxybenzoate polyprenyltransferase
LVVVVGRTRRLIGTLYLCFLESRPTVQVMFLLRFLAGASFAGGFFAGKVDLCLWVAAALWFCATSSVYILNGVMDVEEDRANGSARPVARGRLSAGGAAAVAAGLAALALAGGIARGDWMVWSVLAALVLGWAYSAPPFYLKRSPAGLAAVAILGGLLTYQAGYAAAGGGGEIVSLVVFATMMSLWMGLVGQAKDLSDVEGDRRAGRKSGPVAWGEDVARWAVSGAALCIGVGSLFSAALFAPDLLGSAVVLTCGASVVAALALSPWSRGERPTRRRPYRAFMLTQYCAHLVVLA